MSDSNHSTARVLTPVAERSGRDYTLVARVTLALPGPVLLMAWARATADAVRLPPIDSPVPGISLALFGAMLLLPFASRLLPCPKEIGLCTICIGVSIATGSASGLWLVSPVVALSCFAWLSGYRYRQQNGSHTSSYLRFLPEDTHSPPAFTDYLAFFLFMVLPWLALYEAVLAIGIPPDAISGVSHFEQQLPVLEWTQIFYGSVYLMVLSVPFFAKTRGDLRWFSVRGLWTMLLAYPSFLALPLIAPKRLFIPHSVPGHLLVWEQSLDSPVAAFPSFHVIWALLAAEVYARRWPARRWFFYGWAILVAASCVTTGQHSLLDVLGGFATVALVMHAPKPTGTVRAAVRRILVGAGAFFAFLLAETMAGPDAQTAILVAACFALAGAAIGTLRSVGFYGAVVGATFGVLCAPLSGSSPWLVAGALSVGAPWVVFQMVMRSRTLPFLIWNILTAVTAARLWSLGSPLHLIAGVFLIFTGLGGFAAGTRRDQQSAAIVIVIVGALATALGQSPPAPTPQFSWDFLLPATLIGLVVSAVTGMDFLRTNR